MYAIDCGDEKFVSILLLIPCEVCGMSPPAAVKCHEGQEIIKVGTIQVLWLESMNKTHKYGISTKLMTSCHIPTVKNAKACLQLRHY